MESANSCSPQHPPWTSREDVIAEAKAVFTGPVHTVTPGETFDI